MDYDSLKRVVTKLTIEGWSGDLETQAKVACSTLLLKISRKNSLAQFRKMISNEISTRSNEIR